jgi:hypothetical protein
MERADVPIQQDYYPMGAPPTPANNIKENSQFYSFDNDPTSFYSIPQSQQQTPKSEYHSIRFDNPNQSNPYSDYENLFFYTQEIQEPPKRASPPKVTETQPISDSEYILRTLEGGYEEPKKRTIKLKIKPKGESSTTTPSVSPTKLKQINNKYYTIHQTFKAGELENDYDSPPHNKSATNYYDT